MTDYEWTYPLPDSEAEPEPLSPEHVSLLMEAVWRPDGFEEALAEVLELLLDISLTWGDSARARKDDPAFVPVIKDRILVSAYSDTISPGRWAAVKILAEKAIAMRNRYESLSRLASLDHLTGLYNRNYFYHLTDAILSRGGHPEFRATLLLFDLDNFKQYNDQYGHAVGDDILCALAKVIRGVCRRHDLVARLGGDEFAVLFWDLTPRMKDSRPLSDASVLANRIQNAIAEDAFSSLGDHAEGALGLSGGLAHFPEHGQNALQLVAAADVALRAAKQDGKSQIYVVGQKSSSEKHS